MTRPRFSFIPSTLLRINIWHLAFGVALLARLVLIPNPGFEADISFWKSWGLAVLDLGVIKGLPLTNFNYPTPFAYVLGFMVWIYRLFADPHNFNQFWNNTNLLFLTVAKAFPIAADFGIVGVFLYIGRNAKRLGFPDFDCHSGPRAGIHLPFWIPGQARDDKKGDCLYPLLALVYLFSPLSLIDGALWGQVDSLGVLLLLLSLLVLLKRQPFFAGVLYMVAMMTKLQNMIYGPVFFLFAYQLIGLPGLVRAAAGAFLAFAGLNSEFILARQSWRIIDSIVGNYDYFPWLSLNAYNPWWIVSGARGMQVSDKIAAIGIVNAKTVGLLAFSCMYVFTVVKQFIGNLQITPSSRKFHSEQSPVTEPDLIRNFLESLILVNASFFLFQTQSHDRYAFPLAVFLLLWLPFYMHQITNYELRMTRLKQFSMFYILFTIVYFFNLHNALIVNYPNNGIPFLSALNVPWLTIVASFAHIALFVVFLFVLIRASKFSIYHLAFSILLFLGGLLFLNKPLLLKQPISLTRITPISASTGYASRQVNMPANATYGFAKWGYLSVQYAFYKHGVGTHAPAKEVYEINRKFRRFTFDYGVDTNGGPQGSVMFEVYGDGKKLFGSDIIKRFDLPRHAEVDVTGVRTLELVVTDGGNGNIDDHADWLNPLLFP